MKVTDREILDALYLLLQQIRDLRRMMSFDPEIDQCSFDAQSKKIKEHLDKMEDAK